MCVHVCMNVGTIKPEAMEAGGQFWGARSFLSQCGFQALNSLQQSWLHAPYTLSHLASYNILILNRTETQIVFQK